MDDITPNYKKSKKLKLKLTKHPEDKNQVKPKKTKLDSVGFGRRLKANKDADIIEIWEEQKRIRAEEVQLEKEYQETKAHAKALKNKLKQNNRLIADSTDLQDTLPPALLQFLQQSFLWLKKTYKKAILKILIFWLRLRRSLGIPIKKNKQPLLLKKNIFLVPFVLVIILVGYMVFFKKTGSTNTPGATPGNQAENIPLNQAPEFSTLKPADKKIEDLGGFAKTSPPNAPSAYTFVDAIDSVKIRVTQQQLPDSFKTDATQIERLAKNFYATKVVQVDDTTVYIGKSEKGPQSLVFQKEGLLILIAADKELPDVNWVQYVSNLKK